MMLSAELGNPTSRQFVRSLKFGNYAVSKGSIQVSIGRDHFRPNCGPWHMPRSAAPQGQGPDSEKPT
jgi:hypothetical protein